MKKETCCPVHCFTTWNPGGQRHTLTGPHGSPPCNGPMALRCTRGLL